VIFLALDPDAGAQFEAELSRIRQLLEERLAQYKAKAEARSPRFHGGIGSGRNAGAQQSRARWEIRVKEKEDAEAPFGDDEGHFRKEATYRKFEHITQIDEMELRRASLGMICRHFGRKVSLARIRQLCHTATDARV